MNPRAKKKASAMSQGIGSPKAENAAEKVSVLVSTEAPRPIRATAPSGKGCVMIPTMVARKIASNCQALRDTPDGTGTSQRITPVAIEASSGLIAAPCHGGDGGFAATDAPPLAADLTVNLVSLDWLRLGLGRVWNREVEADLDRERELGCREKWKGVEMERN